MSELLQESFGDPVLHYVLADGHYLGGFDAAPESAIPVHPGPSHNDQVWLFPGWSPSPSNMRRVEDAWRAFEMPIARENVTAIEFGDDSIPGTAVQWKSYWLALRAWTEGAEGYPDAAHRPLKPT